MVKTNFILKREILPTSYYISLKDRILLKLGKKKVFGWYDIPNDEINIHLTNLWIRHKKDFLKEVIKTLIHEEVLGAIEKEFGKRVIHLRSEEIITNIIQEN